MTASLSHATGMRNLVGVGVGWGRSHCSHTFGARCYGETFFFFFAPLADVRRGARLLSPSPGTATHAQLRTPPLRPALKNPPISGVHRSEGVGRRCAVTLSAAGWSCCPWHTHTHTHRSAFYRMCEKGAGRIFFFLAGAGRGDAQRGGRAGGGASRGASSCFPVDHFISITGQKFEGRAAD